MANPEHVAKLKEGVAVWNEWRLKTLAKIPYFTPPDPFCTEDLSEGDIDLSAEFVGVLRHPDLGGANLTAINLVGANLNEADLRLATLNRAQLNSADLRHADLSGADLSDADLGGTNFTDADLTNADLTDATLAWTVFAQTTLRETKGLDRCNHRGPSTIGIETFFRSSGQIPEVFLRGCGVPEQFITYARSLIGQSIEFYSCFISYSTKDQEFAKRLHADLQNKGVPCWFAPHDIAGGKKIHEQIDEAIRIYDRLLLVLSEHSINSEWVKTEIAKARKRELREKRRMLFPVRLVGFQVLEGWECFDADTGKDSAREIREYFIPDFSTWKDHDSYGKAFDPLLRDLEAKGRA